MIGHYLLNTDISFVVTYKSKIVVAYDVMEKYQHNIVYFNKLQKMTVK